MFSLLCSPLPMDHHYSPDMGYPGHDAHGWVDHSSCPPSVHHTPIHEYSHFSFAPVHVSRDSYGIDTTYPRQNPQPLQHSVGPTWPSMLASQSIYMQPMLPTASPQALPNPSQAPASARPHQGPLPVPRRTLSDMDRRRMCQYHETHPTKKQSEIGEIFGVERSTVSKVLRHKEKYLNIVEEVRSPIKRAKGKFPDIERALTNWARNYQKQGYGLTDDLIKEKLAFFATTVGGPEGHRLHNDAWLERFKQKNQLIRPKYRKAPLALEAKPKSNAVENVSAAGNQSSPNLAAVLTSKPEDVKYERVDNLDDRRPFHSQSTVSLSSVFSDSALPSFSNDNRNPSSPLFTPESAPLASSPFMSPSQSTTTRPTRPRSMTMPHLDMETYMSPPLSSGNATPKMISNNFVESPVSDVAPQQLSLRSSQNQDMAASTPPLPPMPTQTMQPPQSISNGIHSSPTVLSIASNSRASPTPKSHSTSQAPPSQYEAHEALKVVMTFLTHAPQGVVVAEPQELLTIGNLMDKLQLQRNGLGIEDGGVSQHVVEQYRQHQAQGQHDFESQNTSQARFTANSRTY